MNPREWKAGDLLELSGYFRKTCTLHAAARLDAFSKLGAAELSAKELARSHHPAPSSPDHARASSRGSRTCHPSYRS
jgi:hypothetical protein